MDAHEDTHVVELEGVFAVAAHVDAHRAERAGHLVRDGVRPILERDGRGRAELVVKDFLHVEEEHGLLLGGCAAVGEALPHFLEDRAELAREERRRRRLVEVVDAFLGGGV